jgi:molybdopterin-binding protein
MKISARNKLPGKIKKITAGPIHAEIIIALADGMEIVAVITRESAKTLDLKKGMEVRAVIKSTDVMVGVCCGHEDCTCTQ